MICQPPDPQGEEEAGTSDDLVALEDAVIYGDRDALAKLFRLHSPRLRRIINFRLDRRIYGRIDADDVLQEAYLNAEHRTKWLLSDRPVTLFIWLRQIVNQTICDVHRRHLVTRKRSARRDVSIHGGWDTQSTSVSLASHLLDHLTTPSQAALRAEMSQQIDAALGSLSAIDREILALRHFEELSNSEAAQVLGMTSQAASMRYVRALERMRDLVQTIPGLRTS